MGYLTTSPAPLRKHEIAEAVGALISTARMDELLYGSGRVYAEPAHPPKDPEERDKTKPWGRVVVLLADFLYPRGQALAGREEIVVFLVRGEVGQPAPDFNYHQALEAILEEAFLRLNGESLSLTKATSVHPIFFRGDVNQRPEWDDDRGVWLQSREFRTVLEPAS